MKKDQMHGVPQGSGLGPLIYISVLTDNIRKHELMLIDKDITYLTTHTQNIYELPNVRLHLTGI